MTLGALRERLSPGALVDHDEAELASYSYDAAVRERPPCAVVLARTARDVVETVLYCARHKVPFTARGAGTNLSGGAVPAPGGLLLSTARLERILEVDTARGFALVEPGLVNLDLQKRLEPLGFYYAPDPSSHRVCTIGGNIAENAGGPRCLKYGVTTNHLLAVEAVMPDGSVQRFSQEDGGCEFLSLLAGSEGTLGVVTKAWLRILPLPQAVRTFLAGFGTLDAAMECVTGIMAAGIVPRALESMDRTTVESVEAYVPTGYPKTEAVLLIELDGSEPELAEEAARVEELCSRHGAEGFRAAKDAAERDRLWEGRRGAYPATARLAPNVLVEDGVVPRDRLCEAVHHIREIAARRDVRTAVIFHAGDGNLHPNIPYDERDPEAAARARDAGHEMLRACVALGGSISGEHGIGLDKREAMRWMFEPGALELFRRISRAVDPDGLANPGKVLPDPGGPARERVRDSRPMSDAARFAVEKVRECGSGSCGMWVTGSGSRLGQEVPGGDGLTKVVTAGMRRVLDLDRRNLTVTVEAGISMQSLHLELAEHDLHVRLPRTGGTLGGLLAVKEWPGVREDLLGMRIVLADGTLLDLGGKMVKNVAGYDVPRLLLGSWGTLAVILDATFRVRTGPLAGVPGPSEPPAFWAGRWQRRIKKAFDPKNLLNPWLTA